MCEIHAGELFLRPIEASDAARFTNLCNDIDIAQNTARIAYPYARADADAFITERGGKNFGANGEYVFAVCRNGEVIACAGGAQKGPGVIEIGYWVGADYRGRGVATLAARAVTQFAFAGLGAQFATAGYFVDNPASGRVLKRIGYEPTGERTMMHSLGRGEDVETIRLSLPRTAFNLHREIVIAARET